VDKAGSDDGTSSGPATSSKSRGRRMSFFPSKCQAEMGRKSVDKIFGREWRSTPQEQIMIRSASKNEFQAYFLKNHEIVKKKHL